MRWKKMILIAPLGILAMLLFVFIGGQIVMYLWNWLLPPLFGFRLINLWQALGLLLLCRILFGGWGHHGGHGRSHFRRRMEERYGNTTSEEREQMRQRMRERFGCGPAAPTENKAQ